MLRIRIAAALTFLTLLAGPVQAGVATADLSVTKTDSPDPVVAGSNLTYTITVENLGPETASNVSLTDAVPPNTTFVSLVAPAGWTATTPPVGGTGTVSATKASLTVAEGTEVFTLVVNVNPGTPDGTTYSNIASVTTTTDDPTPANDSDDESTTVGAPVTTSSPAASLQDAAMPAPDTGSPFLTLGFGALLFGALGVLALARARGPYRP